jgi:hypothetical protein
MAEFHQNRNRFEKFKRPRKYPKDIIREIVDYSYQKDAYMGQRVEGDYLIAYLVEKARRLIYLKDGIKIIQKPQKENAYIGFAVHSASDLNFIKELTLMVTILDETGKTIGRHQHLYHPRPGLHHYGMNWLLPGDGLYTIRVHIETPDFILGGNMNGDRSKEIVQVEFSQVLIQTGQQFS